ncbi:MAG: hypothetical protein WKF30_02585 [Pyrinomonadaceae bacterium]
MRGRCVRASLFWGRSGRETEQQIKAPQIEAPAQDVHFTSPSPSRRRETPQRNPFAAARDVVSSITKDSIKDVFLTRTPQGPAIIADCEDQATGVRRVYAIEARGGARYKLAAQAPLDTVAFRGADWVSEMLDVDGDGYGEVLYTGSSAEGEMVGGRRLVLYVARAHKFYILRIEPNAGYGTGTLRVLWSPNAMKPAAARFRSVLERRARSLIASL